MEEQKLLAFDLSILSLEVIEVLLLDSTVEESFFDEVAVSNKKRPEVLRHLLEHPNTPDATRRFVAAALNAPVPEMPVKQEKPVKQKQPETLADEEEIAKQRDESLLHRIQRMRVGERIQLALHGSRDIRSLLLRDASKEVMLTVLQNQKITESEIEIIAKQKTSPEDVLRTIAKKKEWLKNYTIVHSLVTNPKTPPGIAMQHVISLKIKDLRIIQSNKNVSEGVRSLAKKIAAARRPV